MSDKLREELEKLLVLIATPGCHIGFDGLVKKLRALLASNPPEAQAEGCKSDEAGRMKDIRDNLELHREGYPEKWSGYLTAAEELASMGYPPKGEEK